MAAALDVGLAGGVSEQDVRYLYILFRCRAGNAPGRMQSVSGQDRAQENHCIYRVLVIAFHLFSLFGQYSKLVTPHQSVICARLRQGAAGGAFG